METEVLYVKKDNIKHYDEAVKNLEFEKMEALSAYDTCKNQKMEFKHLVCKNDQTPLRLDPLTNEIYCRECSQTRALAVEYETMAIITEDTIRTLHQRNLNMKNYKDHQSLTQQDSEMMKKEEN